MAAQEFKDQDLTGTRFTHVDLSEAHFQNLSCATRASPTSTSAGPTSTTSARATCGSRAHGCRTWLIDAEVEGTLTVNGVDVCRSWTQLNQRTPAGDRLRRRASDADGFREACACGRSMGGDGRAAPNLPEEKLHERVDDEWSPIQNMRHLVFATDAWIRRAMLGDPSPYDPSTCPSPRWARWRGSPTTPMPARPSTRCWPCARIAWPWCASRSRPHRRAAGGDHRADPQARATRRQAVRGASLPGSVPDRGVGAPPLHRPRPRGAGGSGVATRTSTPSTHRRRRLRFDQLYEAAGFMAREHDPGGNRLRIGQPV